MKKKSFEESLAKLEQITKELEEGDLSLEESLKYFDEGVKLAEQCNNKLNGSLEPEPFDGPEDENV